MSPVALVRTIYGILTLQRTCDDIRKAMQDAWTQVDQEGVAFADEMIIDRVIDGMPSVFHPPPFWTETHEVHVLSEDPVLLRIERHRYMRYKLLHTDKWLSPVIKDIVKLMPSPAVITVNDIIECAAETLVMATDQTWPTTYQIFVDKCIERTNLTISNLATNEPTISTWLPIGRHSRTGWTPWHEIMFQPMPDNLIEFPTTFAAVFEPDPDTRDLGLRITSESSKAAHADGVTRIVAAVESACRTLTARSVWITVEKLFPREPLPFEPMSPSAQSIVSDDEDDDVGALRGLSKANEAMMKYLRRQIGLIFAPTQEKHRGEVMNDARIRNAILLLIESDRQATDSLGLALAMSAIESLLCQRSEGVVDQISRNSAAFLIPDANDRGTAIRKVKKLYDRRSKTLHGVDLAVAGDMREPARDLAAAILFGVMEWCDARDRIEKEAGKSMDFFEQLNDAVVTGKRMVGNSSEYLRAAIDQLPA